jgi:hypothetical protein
MRVVRYTVCTVQYIEYPKPCWLCGTINHRWASITLKYRSVAFIVPNFGYEPVRICIVLCLRYSIFFYNSSD